MLKKKFLNSIFLPSKWLCPRQEGLLKYLACPQGLLELVYVLKMCKHSHTHTSPSPWNSIQCLHICTRSQPHCSTVCSKRDKDINCKKVRTNVDVTCLTKNRNIKNEAKTERWTRPTVSDSLWSIWNRKKILIFGVIQIQT